MMATEADAHREWHWNTGIPMGTPGCPQDACHIDYDEDEPTIRCAHCKGRHHTVSEVRDCSRNACAGGVCKDILRMCSRHQDQYQLRWGRASNE